MPSYRPSGPVVLNSNLFPESALAFHTLHLLSEILIFHLKTMKLHILYEDISVYFCASITSC